MLINNLPNISIIYSEWIEYNLDKIVAVYTEQFNKEDLYNKAYVNRHLMQFYLAFYLVYLVADEYYNTTNKDWNYYITKYDLVNKKKKLGCHNIELDYLLSLFSLPMLISNTSGIKYGIENIGVSKNFIVEPENLDSDANEVLIHIKD